MKPHLSSHSCQGTAAEVQPQSNRRHTTADIIFTGTSTTVIIGTTTLIMANAGLTTDIVAEGLTTDPVAAGKPSNPAVTSKTTHVIPAATCAGIATSPPVVPAAPEPGKHVLICAPLPQDGTEVMCPNCGRAFRFAQGLGSHLLTCRSATVQPAAETLDSEPSSPPPHQQQANDEAGWRQDAETAFSSTCWDCKVSRKNKKFCCLVRLHTDPDWQQICCYKHCCPQPSHCMPHC